MTVIVYRDGVMAADSGSWIGDAATNWAVKIAANDRGLHGVSGNAPECYEYLAWVRGEREIMPRPREENDGSSFVALIVERETRKIFLLSARGEEYFHEAPYMAIGAAAPVAFGALFCGARADTAILACIQHGCNAIGPVRIVTFDDNSVRVLP